MDSAARKCAIGIGFAAALVLLSTAPTTAAPVLSNTAAVKSAADNSVTEVRWVRRGWGRRAAVAAGVGLAVGAASYAYNYPYSGYGYNYSYAPYSSYTYGYAPSSSYSYNYGYAPFNTYGYNYGYTPGYYGYGVRSVARGVARRVAAYR